MSQKKNLEKKWRSNLKQIENSVSKLLENRYFFKELADIIKDNSSLPPKNRFLIWIRENYFMTAAIGMRRLIDKDPRSISLYTLLEDIKNNPERLSRERYRELFKDASFAEDYSYINDCFDKLIGRGKDYIDPENVQKDICSLCKIREDDLIDYVNKTIAHYDKKKIKRLPMVADLDKSIDLLKELVEKYHAIICAELIDLLPRQQDPWKHIFKVPWIPKKEKGH